MKVFRIYLFRHGRRNTLRFEMSDVRRNLL